MTEGGWLEIEVDVPSPWPERVAELLGESTHGAVAFETGPDVPAGCERLRAYLRAGPDADAVAAELTQSLQELAVRAAVPEIAGLRVAVRLRAGEDFERAWRDRLRPFRVGRVAVVPPGFAGTLRPGDLRLELEPGAAFGTGRHTSTRAALAALQRPLRRGDTVVDAGCGSGILAVAAVLCGASRAIGFDVDPLAVEAAQELAARNRVAGSCAFLCSGFELLDGMRASADGVVANVYADLVQSHAGAIARCLRPGGWFAIAGLRSERRLATSAALAAAGFHATRLRARGRFDACEGRVKIPPDRGAARQ